MSYIIVSYFTIKTPYAQEVDNLRKSLRQFGVKHEIQGAPNLGSWEKNCQYKAIFIREMLDQFSEDIVWVDADAVLMKEPVLFDSLEVDLAYHYLPHREELLSGTLFLKNNAIVRTLVDDWIALNDTNMEWDQKNLQALVEGHETLTTEILPAEYCKINKHRIQVAHDPVITHYQASRRFKRLINYGRNVRRR